MSVREKKEIIVPPLYVIRCEFQNSRYSDLIVRNYELNKALEEFEQKIVNLISGWHYARVIIGKEMRTSDYKIIKSYSIHEDELCTQNQ